MKDVQIEELEKQFIPPDITPDMYDWQFDDPDDHYTEFLRETYYHPTQPAEIVGEGNSSVREDDVDPDFIYQEAEEIADVQDDFRFDKSTM